MIMNQSEWQEYFSGFSHLVVKPNADCSEVYVRLPWFIWRDRGRNKALALKERSEMLRKFLSIWKTAWFIYGDGWSVEIEELSHDSLLSDSFHQEQEYGNWMLAFGKLDLSVFHQLRQANELSLTTAEYMKEIGVSCAINSEPDDLEWRIFILFDGHCL
jgi:hypothetical protein